MKLIINNDDNDDDTVVQVHLSFSLYGAESAGEGGKSPQLQWHFLRLFLQSVGIVLTDIQDVVFKYVRHLSDVSWQTRNMGQSPT